MGLRKLDLLARVGKWFPLPDFFLHIFGYIHLQFFLIFSKHFSVYTAGVSLILAAIEYSHLSMSSSPHFLLFLLPVCSFLLVFPVVPTTIYLSWNWIPGGREGTFLRYDFQWGDWGVWGSAPGNWAEQGGGTELSLLLKLWVQFCLQDF